MISSGANKPFFRKKGFVLIFLHILKEGDLKTGLKWKESGFWSYIGVFIP